MLKLSSRAVESRNLAKGPARMVVRVTTQQNRPRVLRPSEAFLVAEGSLPDGFGIYLAFEKNAAALSCLPSETKMMVLPNEQTISVTAT
jgi:hypothetical protein